MGTEQEKKRKNGMQTVRDMAAKSAREGELVSACPYKRAPHKTVWLVAFADEQQQEICLASEPGL